MPIPAKDILGSLYDFKMELKNNKSDKALLIRTEIKAKDSGISGKMIILFEPNTIKRLIQDLKKQSGDISY